MDDNVHMANTIQFLYELQKAGKQVQLMVYPKSRHGVTDPVLVKHLREAGLECRTAVCVVDREEGGADALARRGVRLRPLFRARDIVSAAKDAANPHG